MRSRAEDRPKSVVTSVSKNKGDFQKRRSDSSATSRVPQGNEERANKGNDVPSDIPRDYNKWAYLFEEETDIRVLPKH